MREKDEEEDRISSLPDPIIGHILSFLTTKVAVANTCLLSTAWRHLFLSSPKLIFVHADHYFNCKDQKFINFVNRRFILCRAASISEFRLKCKGLPNPDVFNTWLTALVFGNTKVLELTTIGCQADDFSPPTDFFRWNSLVVLRLSARNLVLNIPKHAFFKNLKVLSLQYLKVHFSSDKSYRLDDQAYPVLEDLTLESIRFDLETTATLEISIPSLKKLAIIDEAEEDYKKITIATPHLEHLKIKYYRFENINLCYCETLTSADFDQPFRHDLLIMAQSKIKILNKIRNVEELHMSYDFCKCFKQNRSHPFPEFSNLSYLNLGSSSETMWILLQRAPILKTFLYDMGHVESYCPPKFEPVCFEQSLREVRGRNCPAGAQPASMAAMAKLLTYFLEHAAELELMGADSVRLRKAVEHIKPLSPRCQSNCVIPWIPLNTFVSNFVCLHFYYSGES